MQRSAFRGSTEVEDLPYGHRPYYGFVQLLTYKLCNVYMKFQGFGGEQRKDSGILSFDTSCCLSDFRGFQRIQLRCI